LLRFPSVHITLRQWNFVGSQNHNNGFPFCMIISPN
jgi:hypothetical protein